MQPPWYIDDAVQVWHGDCLDVLAGMADNSVDAVVTDPPYGLEFMGKDWDRFSADPVAKSWDTKGRTKTDQPTREPTTPGGRSAATVRIADNPRCRKCGRTINGQDTAKGFKVCHCPEPDIYAPSTSAKKYQQWCQTWAEHCLRVLKPGGHLLAFGGTRTHHRLTCAIEDAGFEIRDSVAWIYSTGFPKSLNVSKAIERAEKAADPTVLLSDEARFCRWMREESGLTEAQATRLFASSRFLTGVVEVVNTATVDNPRMGRRAMVPTAAAWEAARPFMNPPPIWVEALVKNPPKPPMQTPSEWKTGKGQGTAGGSTDAARRWNGWGTALKPAHEPIVVARKPIQGTVAANILAWGTGALNIDAARVGGADGHGGGAHGSTSAWFGANGYEAGSGFVASTAGRWPPNVALDQATADQLDRESGASVTHGVSWTGQGGNVYGNGRGFTADMPRTTERVPVTDSGGASRFFPVFRYEPKAPTLERPRIDGKEAAVDYGTQRRCRKCGKQLVNMGNSACTCPEPDPVAQTRTYESHPTVKPLDLIRWLVRLVTPPGGVVLDPFLGSGTTAEACIVEGFRCLGIEREDTYLPMIRARLTKPIQPVLDLGGPT